MQARTHQVGGRRSRENAKGPWTFFVLVFAMTFPFWAVQAFTGITLMPGLPLAALAVVVPVTAAALLMCLTQGVRSIVGLLRRAMDADRTKAPRWYLPAVLLPVVVGILSFGALR